MNGDAPKAIYLRADQPGVVTSGMIEADADVEVLDKDVYIATVSEGGKLDMEMRLKKGRGYVSVEQRQKDKLPIGVIAIDAIYSPVRTVNFTVEDVRVGQRIDFNKITLEIETDGTIEPEQALKEGAQVLTDHFTLISQVSVPEVVREKPAKKAAKKAAKKSKE